MIILGLFIAGVGILLAVSGYVWQNRTENIIDRLYRASTSPPSSTFFTLANLAALPPPVARYFSSVLHDGQPIVRHVRVRQRGEFLVRPTPDGWRPFDATQFFATHPAGFVWDAHIRMAGLRIRVRDAFADGTGSMLARLMGLWPLVSVEGTPEIAAAALQRYLAESVWFPTALLPSQDVNWTELDDSSARATLSVGATTVSLDFYFDGDNLVRRVFTPARGRDVRGRAVPTPWQGHFARYENHSGMKVPMAGEVEWLLPDGPQKYWRGEITDIAFEFWSGDVAYLP